MVAVHSGTMPLIELRRLHRFFGATKAVHDISFDVRPGEVFGYIGPNGAGKTTSMRILATLELPSFGDALVDGFSAINDPDLVRKRMGFMPDGFGVYPNMNCVEYLDFFARSYGLIGRERTHAVKHTLAFTGLDKIAAKPIRGLSKGMRQRLCLGRAMIHDPKVLILDEPANGLDPRARIELRRMIRDLASRGKSILVSSHILTELAEMCDQVGIIERGRLLAVGRVEEIQKQMQPHSQVKVVVLERGAELANWLSSLPELSNLQVEGNVLLMDMAANLDFQAELLSKIVGAGFRPIEFAAKQQSLEDLFMQITTGAVQ